MVAAVAFLAAGTALQLYSQYQQSKYEQASLLEESDNKFLQAEELGYRAKINQRLIKKKGAQIKGQQLAMSASSGVDISTGSSLDTAMETTLAITDQINIMKRETEFEQAQLRKEAESKKQTARQKKKAGMLGMVGTLFGAGAAAAK